MKVTNEKTENRQAYLTIEVEPSEVETATEATYRKLVKKVNIPGFRKGKAPRATFERHIGKHELFHEMLDDMVPDVYKKAIAEQKLEPIAEPQIELEKEDPVILKAVVPLKPVVNLGDYKTIELKPQAAEVTEEMVNAVVEQLRHQHATWEPAERAVEFNDLVTIDVESTMKGEPFVNQKGAQYQVAKESISPAPGFAEQLVEMKKDEEKEFKIQYPADYPQKEVQGNEAAFKVKVIEVKQEKLPEVNDDFAKQVGTDITSMEAMRQKITEDLKKRVEDRVKRDFEDKVIEAATAMSQVEYPPVLVDAEVDHSLERNLRFLQSTGQNIETYLKSIDKTIDQLREELRPTSVKRVAESLVVGKIAEQEKVEVTPAEIDAEIEEMVKNSSGNKDELKKALQSQRNRESIEDTLIARKTIQKLTEIAQSQKEAKKEA
ncbi:MAG: trigger factor [Dehalococcoidales bacterium]|nr:trigger factor [Dehalococcoidales bacterium]